MKTPTKKVLGRTIKSRPKDEKQVGQRALMESLSQETKHKIIPLSSLAIDTDQVRHYSKIELDWVLKHIDEQDDFDLMEYAQQTKNKKLIERVSNIFEIAADAKKAQTVGSPIHVYIDKSEGKSYRILDGESRYFAALIAGLSQIEALFVPKPVTINDKWAKQSKLNNLHTKSSISERLLIIKKMKQEGHDLDAAGIVSITGVPRSVAFSYKKIIEADPNDVTIQAFDEGKMTITETERFIKKCSANNLLPNVITKHLNGLAKDRMNSTKNISLNDYIHNTKIFREKKSTRGRKKTKINLTITDLNAAKIVYAKITGHEQAPETLDEIEAALNAFVTKLNKGGK